MTEEEIDAYLDHNSKCYDRVTFDDHMRLLLQNDYDHQSALDMIIARCQLSAIVFEERIDNKSYLAISASDKSIAGDVLSDHLVSLDMLANRQQLDKDIPGSAYNRENKNGTNNLKKKGIAKRRSQVNKRSRGNGLP